MADNISITVANDISECVFQPADWSVLNIPMDEGKANQLATNLYNSPNVRHTALLLCRHRRKNRLKALKAMSAFDSKMWSFVDSVSIGYDKPSTCSNNGFLPTSEFGFLVCKGASPDTSKTQWFEPEYNNATNNWDLAPREIESEIYKNTYYHKFSWELQLLLYSLVSVREFSRFIYGLPISQTEVRSLSKFCNEYNLKCELIVESDAKKNKIEEALSKIKL